MFHYQSLGQHTSYGIGEMNHWPGFSFDSGPTSESITTQACAHMFTDKSSGWWCVAIQNSEIRGPKKDVGIFIASREG